MQQAVNALDKRMLIGCLADSYTIKVISQDDFEDVPVPAEPVQQVLPPPTSQPHQQGTTGAEAGGWLGVKKWFS